jgi:hypothetical protein
MKYEYKLETFYLGQWTRIASAGKEYLRGYLAARKDEAPRLAYRILRSDGKVIDEIPAREDVSVGMVAGWPTPEQYEQAAGRAIERAQSIRRRKDEDERRRPQSP